MATLPNGFPLFVRPPTALNLVHDANVVKASKFLSLILRHRPEAIGITLDANGWASIDEIVEKSNGRLSLYLISCAVDSNDKQRFAVSEDWTRIRARQGHSIPVELGLVPVEPPEFLFHGTYPGAVEGIELQGLCKCNRNHVHMTDDLNTANSVGMRRGAPVIYRIKAGEMHRDGHLFYRSENGVWLTERVWPKYLSREGAEG